MNNNNNGIKKDYLTTGKVLKSSGKKFYKILSEGLNMKNFQYQIGLNEDIKPFDPFPVCGGGLHFTDNEDDHLWKFLKYGNMIAEIDVLDDEPVVIFENKYKAHKIIIKNVKKIAELSDKDLDYLLSNSQDILKDNLLMNVTDYDYLNVVKWLIEHGTNIHACKDEPLINAANNGYLDIVKYLIANGADIHAREDETLIVAASNGYLDVIKYLIANGADIHAREDEALIIAAYYGHLNIVKCLIANGANIHAREDYALIAAANHGYLNIVKYLIANGANIHAGYDSALKWASNSGQLDVVKFLIEHGADIHAHDESALRYAATWGYLNIVKYLITNGANIHAREDETLSNAARCGNINTVKYLIECGADIHACDESALKEATIQGRLDVVKYLIKCGATAPANTNIDEILTKVIICGHLKVIKYWHNHITNIKKYIDEMMITALMFNKIDIIQYLLNINKNKDIVKNTRFKRVLNEFIDIADDEDKIKVFTMFFKKKLYSSEQMLRMAARENSLELVKLCIEWGANIHTFGEYPLKQAIKNKNEEMKRVLIENGADVEKVEDKSLIANNIAPFK